LEVVRTLLEYGAFVGVQDEVKSNDDEYSMMMVMMIDD
jgi:hypothetical protein